MTTDNAEEVRLLIEAVVHRARLGFSGEKPLALYAMLLVARDSPDRKKAKLLGFFSTQTEKIKDAFLKACDRFGKIKDPTSSWSVITGKERELQRVIAAQLAANEAFAGLSDAELQELIRWFEDNADSQATDDLRSPIREKPTVRYRPFTSDSAHSGLGWTIETDAAEQRVKAWSSFRLPFEPSPEQKKYREELRNAVATLGRGIRNLLRATYTHPSLPDNCDVENVLIYNVGTAAFNTASSAGIMFEFQKSPVPPAPDGRPFDHFTSYEIVPVDSEFRCWRPASAAPASVKGIRCNHDGGELKAGQVWAWVQKRLDRGDLHQSQDPIQGDYAVEIDIHPSSGFSPNTCSWLKPLLDGIVSACHSQPFSLDDELISRVAIQLNRESDCIRKWLTRPELCLLANRSPVEVYRSSVRWHPDDNQCVAASIRIRSDGMEPNSMDMKIYAVQPVRAES